METAFTKSLPIMGSYLFVSMAYGLVMQEAGCGLLLLFLIGADRFMLPALILVSGLLLILQKKIELEEGTNHE